MLFSLPAVGASERQTLDDSKGRSQCPLPILTTSPKRVENLIEVNKRFNNGEGSEILYLPTGYRSVLRHTFSSISGSMGGVRR